MDGWMTYKTNDMELHFAKADGRLGLACFHPSRSEADSPVDNGFYASFAAPPFQLAIASKPYGYCYSLVSGATAIPREMKIIRTEKTGNTLQLVYFHDELELEVTVLMEFAETANFIRQRTIVKNRSKSDRTLTHFSSSSIQGIAPGGELPWYDRKKIRVHYCRQIGQGEGQWRTGSLEELGMYPTSVHNQSGSVQFHSVGSRSCGRFVPMAVIEDMETEECWYFQIESSTHWHFEIGNYGINNESRGVLFFHTNTADERYLGWKKVLRPEEEYQSCPTGFGCCKGGWEDAIREFTDYRRSCLKPTDLPFTGMPLIFNDYMNALWGSPSEKKLLPMIDRAALAGAEVFCIDAGWFAKENDDLNRYLGDWVPDPDRFGAAGFQGIIDRITGRGMIPGIWLELEVCGVQSGSAALPEDWFLHRNGVRVQDGPRLFFNFTNPAVRDHMMSVIDLYTAIGIGYIKNDYNGCIGNGDDQIADSAAEGQIRNVEAFCSFIDSVRLKHPGLILENCASGALRQDYGMLSHFHLQSNSDQEIYTNYPSIIQGESAALLPEHNAIWAYPYPLLFAQREAAGILESEGFLRRFRDGEETVFNMVNGLCGVLLLSGHIECADDFNFSRIREAAALYKKERGFLHNSYPVYPDGMISICEHNSWACLGFGNKDRSRILLAVWRLDSEDSRYEIQIRQMEGKNAEARMIYPADDARCSFTYSGTQLAVEFPEPCMARYFEIIARK